MWMWVLALLGLKSMWRRRVQSAPPQWQEKRHQFSQKMEEAFRVWWEPDRAPDGNPVSEDGSEP